ncbi:MAG: hypothetical protein CME38_11680 [Haliea sp.]|nr:hypothetical protein [Haliea sp.]
MIKTAPENSELPLLSLESFAAQGVHLTAEDLRFLQRALPLRREKRDAAIRAWLAHYWTAHDAEPVDHRKRNTGLRAANQGLLALVQARRGGSR